MLLDGERNAHPTPWQIEFALTFINTVERDQGSALRWVDVLKRQPWSAAVDEAVTRRLAEVAKDYYWLIVVGGTDDAADSSVSAVNWLAHAVSAKAIVYCGDRSEMRGDALVPIAAPVPTRHEFDQNRGLISEPDPIATELRNLASPIHRVLTWARQRWRDDQVQGAIEPVNGDPALGEKGDWVVGAFATIDLQHGPGLSADSDRWHRLVRRVTYPSEIRARQAVDQIAIASLRCDIAIDGLKQAGYRTSAEERHTLRQRARLLALIYATTPKVIDVARTSVNGSYDLFRIQTLVLDSARMNYADAKLPTDKESCPDALVDLLQTSMDPRFNQFDATAESAHAAACLVQPFQSASALRRHIDWLFSGSGIPLAEWEDWLAKVLPERIEMMAKGVDPPPESAARIAKALQRRSLDNPESSVEAAAWLLDLAELERPIDRRAAWDADPIEWRQHAKLLLLRAVSRSTGALKREACMMLSRCEAMSGESKKADRWLETARDELARLDQIDESAQVLIDLYTAYSGELSADSDLVQVATDYASVAERAEKVFATEIQWRAVYGGLRVEMVQMAGVKGLSPSLTRGHRMLRAQMLQQVQTARSAQLMQLMRGNKPLVFVSYRSNARPLARSVVEMITGGAKANAWIDQDRIYQKLEDFSPKIQQNLGSCQAILLILTPGYFESPYCLYELNYALARCGMSGYALPIYWVVGDDIENPATPREDALEYAKRIVQQLTDNLAARGNEFEQLAGSLGAFAKDALARVEIHALCLVNKPLRLSWFAPDVEPAVAPTGTAPDLGFNLANGNQKTCLKKAVRTAIRRLVNDWLPDSQTVKPASSTFRPPLT